jgi:hypothetical protein
MPIFSQKTQKFLLFNLLCLFTLVYGLLTSFSYAEEFTENLGAWQTVTLDVPLTKRVHLNTLTQMRETNNLKSADRLLQFAGVDYDLNSHWSVGAGYAWTPYWKKGDFNNEQRLYQRVMYRNALAGGQLMARDQVEQRFIKAAEDPATWNRLLLQYSHPIPHVKGLSAVVSDELLVQLYSVKHGPQEGFNQNRIFAGLTKDITKSIQVQAGYMNLIQRTANNTPIGVNHVIMTQLNLRPHFTHHSNPLPSHGHFTHH